MSSHDPIQCRPPAPDRCPDPPLNSPTTPLLPALIFFSSLLFTFFHLSFLSFSSFPSLPFLLFHFLSSLLLLFLFSLLSSSPSPLILPPRRIPSVFHRPDRPSPTPDSDLTLPQSPPTRSSLFSSFLLLLFLDPAHSLLVTSFCEIDWIDFGRKIIQNHSEQVIRHPVTFFPPFPVGRTSVCVFPDAALSGFPAQLVGQILQPNFNFRKRREFSLERKKRKRKRKKENKGKKKN